MTGGLYHTDERMYRYTVNGVRNTHVKAPSYTNGNPGEHDFICGTADDVLHWNPGGWKAMRTRSTPFCDSGALRHHIARPMSGLQSIQRAQHRTWQPCPCLSRQSLTRKEHISSRYLKTGKHDSDSHRLKQTQRFPKF